MDTLGLLASVLPSNSKHGFFKTLPRELRDKIYDLLYMEVETFDRMYQLRASLPILDLRLVSRQFELEYSERSSRSDHMNQLLLKNIIDHHLWPKFECPAHAARVTNLVIVLKDCNLTVNKYEKELEYCSSDYYLPRYQRWLNALTNQLQHLRQIRVHLKVLNDKCVHATLESLSHITIQPEVIELKLSRAGHDWFRDANDQHLATWTRHSGLQKDDEAIKQCLKRLSDTE